MIADQKDFITPHITDSHTLDYPCFHSGFVCEYELPHWAPIHIGRFALDISPTRHVVMLWIAALLCIVTTLLALRAHNRKTREGKAPGGFGAGFPFSDIMDAFFGGTVEGVALVGIDDRGALFEQAIDLLVAVVLVIDGIARQIKQPEGVVRVRLDRVIDPERKIGFL